MLSVAACLVDTNILLRLSRRSDPQSPAIQTALAELDRQGAELYFSLQNMTELWNVCTRPRDRNGYGLSIEDTRSEVETIARTMTLLPDSEQVYSRWLHLVFAHRVRGVQVHDARLAALMQAYGLKHILTLNQPDFLRYADLQAIHPSQLQP